MSYAVIDSDASASEFENPSPATRIIVSVVLFVLWSCSARYLVDAVTQFRSEAFPHVMGTMEQYEWQEVGTDGESILSVRYRYTVDGQRYSGDRKRFAYRLFASGSAQAVELAKSWGPGRPVRVFFNPREPSCSALDNLFMPGDWKTLACAAAVFIGISAIAAWQTCQAFGRSTYLTGTVAAQNPLS